MSTAPIGVFDSGIGGLTVVKALRAALPNETILYLGDTARVPYGTKSPQVVQRYAVTCARFLAKQGAKTVVIACNTASAVAIEPVAEALALPVVGVIEPGARLAANASQHGRIGVIGTDATIRSGRYQELLAAQRPDAEIFATACPLLVPLVEEGLLSHAATRLILEDYLAPLFLAKIDTLVLGCTHYPLLGPLFAELCGPEVNVIDSAAAVATAVREQLRRDGLGASTRAGPDRFFATDASERFQRVGQTFLGSRIERVEWVDL